MENYRGFKEVVDNYSGVYVNQLDIYLEVLGKCDLSNFKSEELKLMRRDLNNLIEVNNKQMSERKRKLVMPIILASIGLVGPLATLTFGLSLFASGSLIALDGLFILNRIVPKVKAIVKRSKNNKKAQRMVPKVEDAICFQDAKNSVIDNVYHDLATDCVLSDQKSVREMYDFIIDSLVMLSPDSADGFMNELQMIFATSGKSYTNKENFLRELNSLADQIVERLNMEGNLDNLVNREENIGSSVSL